MTVNHDFFNNINWLPSPNRSSRFGQQPSLFVTHFTGSNNLAGTHNWIGNIRNQVSYSYTIAKIGTIYQHVKDNYAPWANGTTGNQPDKQGRTTRMNRHSTLKEVRNFNGNANNISIAIGFQGLVGDTPTPEQYHSAHILYKFLCSLFGELLITSHREITPLWTNCPGVNIDFEIIKKGGNFLDGEYITSIEPEINNEPPTRNVPDWAADAYDWAMYHGIITEGRLNDTATRAEVVTMLHRLFSALSLDLKPSQPKHEFNSTETK